MKMLANSYAWVLVNVMCHTLMPLYTVFIFIV